MSACPCGSALELAACCGPVLDGTRPAPTPESLMRSRYTAFVRRDAEYLTRSHAAPPPKDPAAFARSLHDITWLDLTVHSAEAGATDDEGFVSFTARTVERDAVVAMSERSRFVREGGVWRYVDGTPSLKRTKVSPNEPCPCGRGTKFKKCHG
jgi:SEC-C motif domain protein